MSNLCIFKDFDATSRRFGFNSGAKRAPWVPVLTPLTTRTESWTNTYWRKYINFKKKRKKKNTDMGWWREQVTGRDVRIRSTYRRLPVISCQSSKRSDPFFLATHVSPWNSRRLPWVSADFLSSSFYYSNNNNCHDPAFKLSFFYSWNAQSYLFINSNLKIIFNFFL